MNYNLDKLNSIDFERMIQSLSRKILGNGTITFGEGTDGGREAIFNGKAPFPSIADPWDGYWIIQAKFKTDIKSEDQFPWIRAQLTDELEKFSTRKTKVKKPNNYLLFSNVRLTAKANSGGRDKANDLEIECQKKYKINNIRIISNDDLIDYLNNNRDVAISYAPFILPGDVLSELLKLLKIDHYRTKRINEVIGRFLEIEFKEDIQSKLDHAGKLTSDKVNLERVFIDLMASPDGTTNDSFKFIEYIVKFGNRILKHNYNGLSRFVLVAGPGYGKSTLTQFLTQVYRAFFLKDIDNCVSTASEVDYFIRDYATLINVVPKWIRLPFKITLKEYAGWIKDNKTADYATNVSVIKYIKYNIKRKTDRDDLTSEDIEKLIQSLPCLFIFDGLDEVPASSNREEVLNEINLFADVILRRLDTDSIIISTTRPQGYSREFDTSKYNHFYITDMQKDDCKIYLKRLLNNIIDDSVTRDEKMRILEKALNDREASRIMKSPLQASIMAILVKSGGEPPTNKFDLFKEYFNTIFNREKQSNIISILSENPSYVKEIHNLLGLYLQVISEKETNPSATITIGEFEKIIRSYLEKMDLDEEDIKLNVTSIITASTDRLVFISQLQDEKVGFAIRSLQEYFAARGYVQNIEEAELRPRIEKICKNAYWSNTLLFIVGYLAEERRFLIDFVESLCGELNGTIDDDTYSSLSSIPKMGSWLALDILKEATFRGNPKTENKFCNLLKPLFNLPPLDKHMELGNLSDRIINKWLYKFFIEGFEANNENLTVWKIIIAVRRNGYSFDDLIDKYLPFDKISALTILRNFIDEGEGKGLVQEKFILCIEEKTKFIVFDILSKNKNHDFFLQTCQVVKGQETKNILFEILFFVSLKFQFEKFDFSVLFHEFGIKIQDNKRVSQEGFLRVHRSSVTVEIVDGYRIEIIKTRLSDNNDLNQVKKLAIDQNLNLIGTFCDFLLTPNYPSFEKLYNNINIQSEAYKEVITDSVKYFNSSLRYIYTRKIFSNKLLIAEVIEFIESLSPDDISNDKLKRIELTEYAGRRILSTNSVSSRIYEFAELYLSDGQNDAALLEFRSLFAWCLENFDRHEFDAIKKNDIIKRFYYDSLWLPDNDGRTDIVRLLYSFSLFKVDEVQKLIENLDILKDPLLLVDLAYSREIFNSEIFGDLLKKWCDIISLQVLTSATVSYKLFFQLIIIGLTCSIQFDFKTIPFKVIINDTVNDDVYRVLILLFDQHFGEKQLKMFTESMNKKPQIFNDPEIQGALVFALKQATNNNFIDEVLLKVDESIIFGSAKLNSEFKSFVMHYVSNKPSNIDVIKLDVM